MLRQLAVQVAAASSAPPAPPRAGRGRSGGWPGCSASSRGRAGTRRAVLSPARGGSPRPPRPAASAASRRPRSLSRLARLLSDIARSGRTRRAVLRQLAADRDRLLGRLERRLAPAESAQAVGQVVERHREVGPNASGRALASSRRIATASSAASSAASAPAESAQPVGQVVERAGDMRSQTRRRLSRRKHAAAPLRSAARSASSAHAGQRCAPASGWQSPSAVLGRRCPRRGGRARRAPVSFRLASPAAAVPLGRRAEQGGLGRQLWRLGERSPRW